MIIAIAGERVTYRQNTLSIDDAVGERSTATFVVVDRLGNQTFMKGQRVSISRNNGSLIYGGVIDNPTTTGIRMGGAGRLHEIQCVDWHFLADKRIIARAYEDEYIGDIVRDIADDYLAEEGITYGIFDSQFVTHFMASDGYDTDTIQQGRRVTEAVFNYVPVSQALDSLAEKGYEWWIDRFKRLHFVEKSYYKSPINITDSSPIRNVQVSSAGEKYRNQQYVKAGRDETDPQTERFRGNGAQRSFTVGYPIARVPTVSIIEDGQEILQSVGIRGVEEDRHWYWSKNDNTITQEQEDDELTDEQELQVEYRGFFEIVVLTRDENAIEERMDIEGGTGIHEKVENDQTINTRQAAFELANIKLVKYAHIGNRIRFQTEMAGLNAGQLLPIALSKYDLDSEFLIESVSISELGDRLRYDVAAVDGASIGGWSKFFKDILISGVPFIIRDNISEDDVLITLEEFDDEMGYIDDVGIIVTSCPVPSEHTYPSNNLYPC